MCVVIVDIDDKDILSLDTVYTHRAKITDNNNTSIIIKALIKCWLLWNRQVLKYVDFLLTWGHIVIIPGTTDVDAR